MSAPVTRSLRSSGVGGGGTTGWEKMNNVPIPQQPLLSAWAGELGIGACIGLRLAVLIFEDWAFIQPSHHLSSKIKDQL